MAVRQDLLSAVSEKETDAVYRTLKTQHLMQYRQPVAYHVLNHAQPHYLVAIVLFALGAHHPIQTDVEMTAFLYVSAYLLFGRFLEKR